MQYAEILCMCIGKTLLTVKGREARFASTNEGFGIICEQIMYRKQLFLYLNISADNFTRNWVLFYLGFIQSVGVGWIYKIDRQYRRVGIPAVLAYNFGCFLAVLVPSVVGL